MVFGSGKEHLALPSGSSCRNRVDDLGVQGEVLGVPCGRPRGFGDGDLDGSGRKNLGRQRIGLGVRVEVFGSRS